MNVDSCGSRVGDEHSDIDFREIFTIVGSQGDFYAGMISFKGVKLAFHRPKHCQTSYVASL